MLGWNGAIASDIPIGAGLSSSAALEVAAAKVFDRSAVPPTSPVRIAAAAQRAEQDWVGMECGIMDQMVVASAVYGNALLLDCRNLETLNVPIPDGISILVLDASTRRQLTASAYNERAATCRHVASILGRESLRDASLGDLEAHRDELTAVERARARHVNTENDRVMRAASALAAGDVAAVGDLMHESHRSLRDDYEVSSPELDAIVAAATESTGCLGARMTGAGFGGCGVAIAERSALPALVSQVKERYRLLTGLEAALYACDSAAGAVIVPIT